MRALALMYHDVVPPGRPEASGFAGPSADHYKLDREVFRAQLDALAASAARPVVSRVDQADLSARPWPVFLTFDDGGVSAHDPIASWLEERGWRGHFFVTTDWIGKPGFVDAGRVARPARQGPHHRQPLVLAPHAHVVVRTRPAPA